DIRTCTSGRVHRIAPSKLVSINSKSKTATDCATVGTQLTNNKAHNVTRYDRMIMLGPLGPSARARVPWSFVAPRAHAVLAFVRPRFGTAAVAWDLAIVDPLLVARLDAKSLLGSAGRLIVALIGIVVVAALDRGLLRARRDGPRRRRAAEQRYEFASFHHSITSSARARKDSGIVSRIRFRCFDVPGTPSKIRSGAPNFSVTSSCEVIRERARLNLIDCGFLKIRSSSRQCPGSAAPSYSPPCGFARYIKPSRRGAGARLGCFCELTHRGSISLWSAKTIPLIRAVRCPLLS